MISQVSLLTLFLAASVAADVVVRTVDQLNEAAFQEAHQRDNTATRAFSNIEIRTSDGKCLFVDELSGDFRANLNPVQIAECGSTTGQTWDIITSGKHNDQDGQILVVNTLTQACLNFDPRRPAGNQVVMFSCGGRADGSGAVTDSQLFKFDGSASLALVPRNVNGMCLAGRGEAIDAVKCVENAGEQIFTLAGAPGSRSGPTIRGSTSSAATLLESQAVVASSPGRRRKTKCSGRRRTFTVTNFHTVTASMPGSINTGKPVAEATSDVVQTTAAELPTTKDTTRLSTSVLASDKSKETTGLTTSAAASDKPKEITGLTTTALASGTSVAIVQTSSKRVTNATTTAEATNASSRAVTVRSSGAITVASSGTSAVTSTGGTTVVTSGAATAASSGATTAAPSSAVLTTNPMTPVPVSRAGGTLNPSAAAEANDFDDTAVRVLESVNIRAADGRCLFIDPTAGDFRQNLIPVQLVKCGEEPNQKFDVVTKGKHNDGKAGKSLLVSVLMDGCLSFDGPRPDGDTVTIFSCGGRAAGDGGTDSAQLYSFDGSNSIVMAPASGRNETCLVAGKERLVSTACTNDGSQTFELVEVL